MATHSLLNLSNITPSLVSPNGRHSGVDITIQNVNDSGYVYVGASSDVSSTNYGFRIMPNHSISFELPGFDSLYLIASTTGLKAAIITTNLESGS